MVAELNLARKRGFVVPSTSNIVFAQRLRELRQKNNWTQEDLANRLGMTKQSINNYELGKHGPSRSVLAKLAIIFNVPVSYLSGTQVTPPFVMQDSLKDLPPNSEERAQAIIDAVKAMFRWQSHVYLLPDVFDLYLSGDITDEELYVSTYNQFLTMYRQAKEVFNFNKP